MFSVDTVGVIAAITVFFVQTSQAHYMLKYRHNSEVLRRTSLLSACVLLCASSLWTGYTSHVSFIAFASSAIDLICAIVIISVLAKAKPPIVTKLQVAQLFILSTILVVSTALSHAAFAGMLATMCSAGIFLPTMMKLISQMRRNNWHTLKIDGCSTLSTLFVVTGSALWIWYAILLHNPFLLISALMHEIAMSITLILKIVKYVYIKRDEKRAKSKDQH